MHDSAQGDTADCSQKAIALLPAMTYDEYLVAHPELSHFMRGRDREIRFGAEEQLFFATYDTPVHLLAVVCATDQSTPVILPILARIGRGTPRANFWIIDAKSWETTTRCIQDLPATRRCLEADELPLLFVLNVDLCYLTEWGPAPDGFAPRLESWAADRRDAARTGGHHGAAAELPMHEIRLWYNSGLTAECVTEIRNKLESVQAERVPPGEDGDDGAASE